LTSFGKRLAAERPDEIALADDRVRLRWDEVDTQLNRMVDRLMAADLGPQNRVAVLAANAAETVLVHMAGVLAGASVVPVNSHLTGPETAFILCDAGARLVLAGPETADVAAAAAREVGAVDVVAWRAERAGVTSLEDWLDGARDVDPPEDHRPAPQVLYTSGTTGRPKGAELPPASFAGGDTIAEHVAALGRLPLAELGTHLVVGPMYHTGPLNGVRLLAAGVPLRVMPRFDARDLLRTIESERVETSFMVPTHFSRLLALPVAERERYDVGSLRYVIHSGAACPVTVKRAMLEWWGPVLYEVYGATEVGPTCGIGPHGWLKHPGSVGRPIPPLEVMVLDDDGREVPARTEGVIHFRDPTGRGIRYVGASAPPPAAGLGPGVFTLGEIGYVDADGYVFLTDRAADMVVSGGVNVYPAEAEGVLRDHPDVVDVACIGVPHAEMGEELVALVVPAPATNIEPAALLAHCRDGLAHYKCPRRVEIVESLPRTELGKLNKRSLRDLYLASGL
jgi:long-chain acyl-CoA synthetase